MKKVLVIAGVTASGKSKLGIDLAHAFNGEIISADSVAIYKELDVGSAKLSLKEQDGVVHHLMDQIAIDQSFDVAQFQKEGRILIDDIISRGKLPIVVGGTGLYINALVKDYRFEKEQDDVDESIFDAYDNHELKTKLDLVDKIASDKIHVNNRKRLIRALVRYENTSQTQSENTLYNKDEFLYDAKVFFLAGDREKLYERMNMRVDLMMEKGLLEEVTQLNFKYQNLFEFQGMQSIGYREFRDYFLGNKDLDATLDDIRKNTRRFSKRQWTWFKHQIESESIDIFSLNEKDLILSVESWLGD